MDLHTIISVSTTSFLLLLTISSAAIAWKEYITRATIGTNTTEYNIAQAMTFFSFSFICYILDDLYGILKDIRPHVIGIFLIVAFMYATRFAFSLNLKYRRWHTKNPSIKITTSKLNTTLSTINALSPSISTLLIIISLFFDPYQTEFLFLPTAYVLFLITIFYKIPFIGIYIPTKISLIIMIIGSIANIYNYMFLLTPVVFLYVFQQIGSISIIGSFSLLVYNIYISKNKDPLH